MFKKLRNRFLMLNMSFISVVMIAAFAVIYSITYNNMQMENQKRDDYRFMDEELVEILESRMSEYIEI